MIQEELTQEERQKRIQAMREVITYMNTGDVRKRIINQGYGNSIHVVAAFEDETLFSVQKRMCYTGSDRIVLGVVYPERSEHTIIPRWRRVQIILWERQSTENTDSEDFSTISPNATVGMFCDYLWSCKKRVMIPDFTSRMTQFLPSTKRALVLA